MSIRPAASHTIGERLDYLRWLIETETISAGEVAELQSLADHIDRDDIELLQWAGVSEFHDEGCSRTDLFADTVCRECR